MKYSRKIQARNSTNTLRNTHDKTSIFIQLIIVIRTIIVKFLLGFSRVKKNLSDAIYSLKTGAKKARNEKNHFKPRENFVSY